MKVTYGNIGKILVKLVPDLLSAYEAAFYEGKPLVHVFLGDVARYVREETKAIMNEQENVGIQKTRQLQAILDVMEEALASGSEELKGAVMASFLEGLDTNDEKLFRRMVNMMGPTLKKAVRDLTEFYHSKEWLSFLRRMDRKR